MQIITFKKSSFLFQNKSPFKILELASLALRNCDNLTGEPIFICLTHRSPRCTRPSVLVLLLCSRLFPFDTCHCQPRWARACSRKISCSTPTTLESCSRSLYFLLNNCPQHRWLSSCFLLSHRGKKSAFRFPSGFFGFHFLLSWAWNVSLNLSWTWCLICPSPSF